MFEKLKLGSLLKDYITPENIAKAKDMIGELGLDGKFDAANITAIVDKISSLIPADKLDDFKSAIGKLIK